MSIISIPCGIFPRYCSTQEAQADMERRCGAHLHAWRMVRAAHKSAKSVNAKLRMRSTLEQSFDELQWAFYAGDDVISQIETLQESCA